MASRIVYIKPLGFKLKAGRSKLMLFCPEGMPAPGEHLTLHFGGASGALDLHRTQPHTSGESHHPIWWASYANLEQWAAHPDWAPFLDALLRRIYRRTTLNTLLYRRMMLVEQRPSAYEALQKALAQAETFDDITAQADALGIAAVQLGRNRGSVARELLTQLRRPTVHTYWLFIPTLRGTRLVGQLLQRPSADGRRIHYSILDASRLRSQVQALSGPLKEALRALATPETLAQIDAVVFGPTQILTRDPADG